jgi:hypothetical protein
MEQTRSQIQMCYIPFFLITYAYHVRKPTNILQAPAFVITEKGCSKRSILGSAIAQAVSRWFPAAAEWVRSRVWSSGICGGQSGGGAGFLRVLRWPHVNSHFIDCYTFIIYYPGLVQKASLWPTYQVDSVSPHPQETQKRGGGAVSDI